MISYKVKSVKLNYIGDTYTKSFVLYFDDGDVNVKLSNYSTYILNRIMVKKGTQYYIEVPCDDIVKDVDIVVYKLDSNAKENISVKLNSFVLQRIGSYVVNKIKNNCSNGVSRILSKKLGDIHYSIDNLEYLPKYQLAKITGWAFSENGELEYIVDDSTSVLGFNTYKREDVSALYDVNTNVGFEAICKTKEDATTFCFGFTDCVSNIELNLGREQFNSNFDDKIQREKAERSYVSSAYVYKKRDNYQAQTDSDVDIVAVCNSIDWINNILEQANKMQEANCIIVANMKHRKEFTEVVNESCVKCELLFSSAQSKEELTYCGIANTKKKYFFVLEQEDIIDPYIIPYLKSLMTDETEVACSDYDLSYKGNRIIRIVRDYNSWVKENPTLSLVSCLIRTTITKGTKNYEELLEMIKSKSRSDAFSYGNHIGYHYNCVEENWTKDYNYKQIAFYLTQYHENEENNKWWGEGFTEWTNVKKGQPMYKDHNQPRVPGELGYYDLVEEKDIFIKQTDLAKDYGINGFCFYYYWFNGKRLLRRPLDRFIENKDIDFSYCICWANESWTRRWDGLEQEILMEQIHNSVTDEKFIYDVIPMLKDSRYIRVDGKPILLVYRMELFPNPAETIKMWRQICREEKVGEIHVSLVQSFNQIYDELYGADSATEFPPHKINMAQNICINEEIQERDVTFEGNIYCYETTVKNQTNIVRRDYCLLQGSMLEWDNTARRKNKSNIFANFSPELFRIWCIKNKYYTKLYNYEKANCVFINAWNEWAEGSYLEPDMKYGKTMLEITKEVSKIR